MADAIRRLAVRGAPAIGVAAAYGLALGVRAGRDPGEVAELLAATRPTASDLRWALERGLSAEDPLAFAQRLHEERIESDRRIGEAGAELLEEGDRVLTHCNAGALATSGLGTAGGVLQVAWERGRLAQVWVDETRPLLQGSRLTAWELERLGIPYRLVTDAAVGALMARGLVDRVVVGADRVARNGDVANKIGTYPIAVLAHRHGVPFYVAAPRSTIDLATPDGAGIPIEERDPEEVTRLGDRELAPAGAEAANIAFDVTPAELVTAIVTERGVARPPYPEALARIAG